MKLIFFFIIIEICCIPFSKARIYYVDSSKGNDSFSGTMPERPWKSVAKVNKSDLKPGDSVLFKRGETWRDGFLLPKSGNENRRIYYGAYGKGKLPLLIGSENMNDKSDWRMESSQIWVCNKKFPVDIGNIIFDQEHHTGVKKWKQEDLKVQDDFYYRVPTGELVMFSIANPASRYKIIECALRNVMADLWGRSYITFENLAFKYGGSTGLGGGSTSHITIRNCELSWIGGGKLNDKEEVRFGNAVEFWHNASDNLVENNKIWEIFDTAVTNQSLYEGVQKNIIYRNNLIWNCGMSAVEIWNQIPAGITKSIFFENNTCVNIGQGWGKRSALHTGSCFISFDNNSATDSVFVRNNIFVTPTRFFYFVNPEKNYLTLTIDNNCYYAKSPADTFYYNYGKKDIVTVKDLKSFLNKTGGDRNSIYFSPQFVDEKRHNYRLRKNSPCRDTGAEVNNPSDFEGVSRPQGKGFDIGAFEYVVFGE